jgi:predicted amidohydrolase YtcJ
MYWAAERLGETRLQGAYAYQDLLRQLGWLPLGTDFPVEDISPIKTFFAATIRKDAKGYPDTGFMPRNALSRLQTLRGITIWAAKAAFEEAEKGSLEAGKYADFVVLDTDLITAPEAKLLNTKVLETWVGGKRVY